jgi:hypothetical protein
MRLFAKARVSAVMLLMLGSGATAQASCTARHLNGQIVPVREVQGPSMFWAHAAWAPDGWPTITYGPTYYQLPPIMRRFTTLHECAHLVERTTNEFGANCKALQVMRSQGLSPEEEAFIKNFHLSMRILGPQYGGSGSAFWFGTLQACGE